VAAAVLVPLKGFALAKGRLAHVLDAGERVALARRMAAQVLAAASPLPVAVVTGDDEVASFATAHGAGIVADPGGGLDAAVRAGVRHLAAAGFDEIVVAHADLPLAAGLAALAGRVGTCTLVPDRRRDGTNVLVVPTDAGFRFAYGPGSFARHVAEAARVGLAVHVVTDRRLALDVDVPEDLGELGAVAGGLAGVAPLGEPCGSG
jgi:2-phospho-L-lactate/phosphoenolpyruvate guanylyltransferase